MLGKALTTAAAGSAAASLGIEDVFSTWLYTGNGSTQTITNGIDLSGEGGLVWTKGRSGATGHRLVDTARGTTKSLESNSTAAEATESTGLTSFNSTGFALGADADYNTNAATYASWTFRKAPRFFDVVTYTGTGSAQTIAHNLGSTPGCIIVKATNNIQNWSVYHRSLGATKGLSINTTSAAATSNVYWNDTEPTSTQFTVGSAWSSSSKTYVAYLFAHDEQIFGEGGDQSVIKCGSYTGNGSTTGPVIDLGWEPQWVLIKSADRVDNWFLFDNMRGISVGSADRLLHPNQSDAEDGGTDNGIALLPNGFQVEGTDPGFNQSGNTHIYIAIRRGPMKTPTSGTEVFSMYKASGSFNDTIPSSFPPDAQFDSQTTASGGKAARARLIGDPALFTSSTAAETVGYFTWDRAGGQAAVTATYPNSPIFWQFRRAPGFFDVVAYTGTGVARTVPHNLGVAPELMIVKRRNLTESWQVYVVPVSPSSTLELNTANGAAAYTNRWDGASTATEIKLLTHNSVNASGSTYIAYLFATLPGISKVFSFTGNGTSQTIDCGFTSGARFVLVRRTDSTGNWLVADTARGIVSGNDPLLYLNSTAAEITTLDWIDPDSSGFIVNQEATANANVNGATYIGLAIA